MPFSTILILTGIVSVFAAFMITLGGVSGWIAVSERRERTARRRAAYRAALPGRAENLMNRARRAF